MGEVTASNATLVIASESTTPGEGLRQHALAALQGEMANCTHCVAAGFIPSAHPIFQGHAGQRLMVVGQAPGPSAAQRSVPYSGATGKTLQAWLSRAGFAEGALHRDFYLTSLTKCFPGPATSGKGDRPPSAAEIALCARHLEREIALVQPAIILALGRLSITRLDSSTRLLPLLEVVGTIRPASYAGHDFLLVPLPHPSGVSRWLNAPENRERLNTGLRLLQQRAFGEAPTDGAGPD
jgi:uracil-DNA glycosylase family 4